MNPYLSVNKQIKQYMVRNHQDGYPYINLSYFFFFENIQKRQFFLEKLIGQWILDRDGRGIARDKFK